MLPLRTVPATFRFAIFAALIAAAYAVAQSPAPVPAGPIPPAIIAAKAVFVSNTGADSGLFPDPFSGSPSRPYMEFYDALKATGDYSLVNDPSQADLVLELRLTPPYGPSQDTRGPFTWPGDPLPMFRPTVYDRKTHYVLWTCTQSVQNALPQKNHDRNFR